MPLVLITAPTSEPVTLAQARLQVRMDADDTADDERLTRAIKTARKAAEHDLGIVLMPQTWEVVFDGFPSAEIELGKWPVQSVTSVTYIDVDGDEQSVATTDYYLDSTEAPGFVLPADGVEWPETMDTANAVSIRFVCGYANAAAVPETIIDWMLLYVEHLYNRIPMPTEFDRMLDSERVYG